MWQALKALRPDVCWGDRYQEEVWDASYLVSSPGHSNRQEHLAGVVQPFWQYVNGGQRIAWKFNVSLQ
jgi:hypothetical protein